MSSTRLYPDIQDPYAINPPALPTDVPVSDPPSYYKIELNIDSNTVTLFIVTLLVFLVIDMLFIYTVTGPMFKRNVAEIQGSPLTLKYAPALLMYVIMTCALFYFVIYPQRNKLDKLELEDYVPAFILGLAIFAAFDLTNLAIFEKYSAFTAGLDMLWGSTLFVLTTYGISLIHTHILFN